MMLHRLKDEIDVFAASIQKSIEIVCQKHRRREIADEDDFTSHMLSGMEILSRIGFCPQEMNLRYLKLRSSSGAGGEESRIGADILFLLNVDLPDFKTKKALLVQSKILEEHTRMVSSEWRRLRTQCELMLDHSVESYALFYSTKSVKLARAHAILGLAAPEPWQLELSGFDWLFYHFLTSHLGDPKFLGGGEVRLEAIVEEFAVPHAMQIDVTRREDEPEPLREMMQL